MANFCRMQEQVAPTVASKSSPVLESLGVSHREEQLYRVLVAQPNLTLGELAHAAGMTPPTAKKTLMQLEEKGLVSRTPEARLRFVPTAPDVALEALIARREEELARAKVEAGRLLEQFRASADYAATTSPVDLVNGYEATRQRVIQVQRSARSEVRIFDRPPYVIPPGPNTEELLLLESGIRYRVIYDETSFDVAGTLDDAKACAAAGEEARVFSGVPIKLIAADRRLALTHDPRKQLQDVLVVHHSPLLNAVINYFDLLWEQATPLFGEDAGSTSRGDLGGTDIDDIVDRQILAMLSAGAGDEAIARRLGLGARTVRRRLARLMESLQAKTRFQAGVSATKRGWI